MACPQVNVRRFELTGIMGSGTASSHVEGRLLIVIEEAQVKHNTSGPEVHL